MRYALVNPNWSFTGSTYFGCRERHLPIELGYSKALLERAGHEALLVDAHMEGLADEEILGRVGAFAPHFIVAPTAPTYLFWRCPQPELRVTRELFNALSAIGAKKVAIGPHPSVTPAAALRKLGADIAVMGEPETVLPQLAGWLRGVNSVCYLDGDAPRVQGGPRATDMAGLPALAWPDEYVSLHGHQHHRFGARTDAPGAEVEASRGCPYNCTFCAKREFRTSFRKRPLPVVLEEIDRLVAQGAGYVYFIDEIFMPDRILLNALAERKMEFGIQTRIDLWKKDMLELLARAGCVSIEAGVESVTETGRNLLGKRCALPTGDIVDLLSFARTGVPFVQATLLDARLDDPGTVEAWRARLIEAGIWVNKPVPLFPYPGSEEYSKRWGEPDERAWERAHDYYLRENGAFSDIQDSRPTALEELEGL